MLNYDTKLEDHDGKLGSNSIQGDLVFTNPFPGLRPFGLNESHLYFGRENQVDEILVKLASNHFVTVIGYSGSGKSSLIYCGLIPSLYGGFMPGKASAWNVIIARPGMSPLKNLAQAIFNVTNTDDHITKSEEKLNISIISSMLKGDTESLITLTETIKNRSKQNTLIFIDQFEELFRYMSEGGEQAEEEAKIYVTLLLEACRNTNVDAYVSISMRSDFVGQCSAFPGLTQMINQSNYLVPQMSREQKRLAIEGPIAVGGGEISNRLTKRLLNEIGDNQDQLPILQHALMRTWDYWVQTREENEPIDIRHYNAIGRISQALSQHADEAYDTLSPTEKSIAEVLFKSLTEKINDNFGIRRAVKLGLVVELTGAHFNEVVEVVEKFRKPGRSFLMPPSHVDLSEDSIIEISHESLMRIWTRLKAWVDEEHESAQMYRRLSEAAAMYQVGKTGLWRPPDLQLALNWQGKQLPTRAWAQRYDEAFERAIVFLDTSRITYEAEQRNQDMLQKKLLKRTRMVAVFFACAAVVSIFLFVFGITRNIEANKQRDLAMFSEKEASIQRDIAIANEKEANDLRLEATKQALFARKAEERVRRALYEAEEQRNYAQEQFEIAQQQKKIAESERHMAQDSRQKAELEFQRAETNYTRAQKLLYLSIAQSMAVKSLSIEENNLKGLLAQQAFIFNKEYGGRIYDPYIYNGLYSALKQINGKTYNAISGLQRNSIKSVVFKHGDNTFFSTGSEGKIVESALFSQAGTHVINSHPFPNRVLAISPDDHYLISGSDSVKVNVFNLKSPEKLMQIDGHLSFINDFVFISDATFISASNDATLRLNSIKTLSSEEFLTLDEPVLVMSLAKERNKLAVGTRSGKVLLIDLVSKKIRTIAEADNDPVHAINFNPKNGNLAVGKESGVIRILKAESYTALREFSVNKARITALEFDKTGELLASSSLDKSIHLWVTSKFDELPIDMAGNEVYVWDVKFNPSGEYLIAACANGNLRIWPTKPSILAGQMCEALGRNMTDDEWIKYVGHDIPIETTCIENLLKGY